MFSRPLLRAIRRPLNRTRLRFCNPPIRLVNSSSTPPENPLSRFDRINRRLATSLHKYTSALATAPVSHITSFLILHELTAIIPLLGLAATFHYTKWLPAWFSEGKWVTAGVQRFGRYFERKGWIKRSDAREAEREVSAAGFGGVDPAGQHETDGKVHLEGKDRGVRWVVEFATAYAIVKILLVPRILFSVWATPGFAKWTVVPIMNMFKR